MKKADVFAAFEGVNCDVLPGSHKQKEITRLYLEGVPTSEIAEMFSLTRSRIGQVVARLARRALCYKQLQNDLEIQALVQHYTRKISDGEQIVIESKWDSFSKHMLAVNHARKQPQYLREGNHQGNRNYKENQL